MCKNATMEFTDLEEEWWEGEGIKDNIYSAVYTAQVTSPSGSHTSTLKNLLI